MKGPLVPMAALATLLTAPAAVRANCARPVSYELVVSGSTVTVQPWNHDGRGCGGTDEMLRQEVATGETVRLAEFCGPMPVDPDDGAPYLDECVPSGTYRYGFARPYDCDRQACGTYRYREVEVTAPLEVGCTRSAGNSGPAPIAPVGWTADDLVCAYEGPGSGFDWGGLGCGCGTVRAGAGAVLAGDALAAGLGLALLRRRRVRRT